MLLKIFLFLGTVLPLLGLHFVDPMKEGNTVGILLLLSSLFSVSLGFIFQQKIQKLIFVSGILSVCIGFSFVFIDDAHNDLYRYLWDGEASSIAQEVGKNVYEVTPWETYSSYAKASMDKQTEDLFQKTGFKNYYTTYPPSLQLVLWGSAEIFPLSQRGLKFVFFLFYLGIILLGYKIFSQNGETKKWIPSFFLSPLLLWEGIAAGHSEILFVFFLLLTLYAWQKKYFFLLGISLAMLTWVKYFPAVLGLVFVFGIFRKKGRPQAYAPTIQFFKFFLGGMFTTLLLWFAFYPFDPQHFLDALKLYGDEWRMFPLFFDFFESFFSLQTAQLVQLSAVLGMIFYGIQKKFSLQKQIFYTFLVYLFFAPAVFSWYFLWIFPLSIFVLGAEKKYFFLAGIFITPFVQYFFTVWDNEQKIFYYHNNGLELSQQLFFWSPVFLGILREYWRKKRKNSSFQNVLQA